jgi:hypothetical protein
MRLPQVSERIKEAPAQALRGVFAGIGQLLLVTDKLRNKVPAHAEAPQARAPEPAPGETQAAAPEAEAGAGAGAEAAGAGEPTAAAPEGPRDFDKTGNVRLLTDEGALTAQGEAAAEQVAAEAPAEAAEPVAAEAAVTGGEAEGAGVAGGAGTAGDAGVAGGAGVVGGAGVAGSAGTAGGGAPLPNYEALTVASLRARLRNLSVAQVRELAEYERAHAARPEVIAMFERRVARLEAGA